MVIAVAICGHHLTMITVTARLFGCYFGMPLIVLFGMSATRISWNSKRERNCSCQKKIFHLFFL